MLTRRLAVILPVVLLLFLAAAYFGIPTWIESGGGRQAVEDQLTQASGMQVQLTGDFDVSLLPVPGVRATRLEIKNPVSGEIVAVSREVEADLSLGALFEKRLHVDRLELSWLTLGPESGQRFSVPRMMLTAFEPGQQTYFDIDLGLLGAAEGTFTWRPELATVDLVSSANLVSMGPVVLEGVFEYSGSDVVFDTLELGLAGQVIHGSGCYKALSVPVLNLDLQAGRLDVSVLEKLLPGGGQAGAGLPLDVNLRLQAEEMIHGDLAASDAVLEYGSGIDGP